MFTCGRERRSDWLTTGLCLRFGLFYKDSFVLYSVGHVLNPPRSVSTINKMIETALFTNKIESHTRIEATEIYNVIQAYQKNSSLWELNCPMSHLEL